MSPSLQTVFWRVMSGRCFCAIWRPCWRSGTVFGITVRKSKGAGLMFARLLAAVLKEIIVFWRDPRARAMLFAMPAVQVMVFGLAATWRSATWSWRS